MSYATEFASLVKNRGKHDTYTDTKPAMGFLASWIVGAVALSLIPMIASLYLYMQGFGQMKMGYAAALAWVLVVIVAVFTLINFALSKYWVHYED